MFGSADGTFVSNSVNTDEFRRAELRPSVAMQQKFLVSYTQADSRNLVMIKENKLLFGAFEKCVCSGMFCSHEICENSFISLAAPFNFSNLSFKNFSLLQNLCKADCIRWCCQRFSFLVGYILSLGE